MEDNYKFLLWPKIFKHKPNRVVVSDSCRDAFPFFLGFFWGGGRIIFVIELQQFVLLGP